LWPHAKIINEYATIPQKCYIKNPLACLRHIKRIRCLPRHDSPEKKKIVCQTEKISIWIGNSALLGTLYSHISVFRREKLLTKEILALPQSRLCSILWLIYLQQHIFWILISIKSNLCCKWFSTIRITMPHLRYN